MNIILGSGVNAFIARHILGPDHKVISSGYSRFYNHNPTPADNFIRCTDGLSEFPSIMSSLGVKDVVCDYRCCWSAGGDLVADYDQLLCSKWLSKIHGPNIPGHLMITMKNAMNFKVYGTRVSELYRNLLDRYLDTIYKYNVSDIRSIGDHVITMSDGSVVEFDRCISTIPLNTLYKFRQENVDLQSVGITAILLESDSVDIEGYNQTYVTDDSIPFFKVVNVKPNHYIFYFTGKVESPAISINPYVSSFDLISGMYIPDCIPSGDLMRHENLKKDGIIQLGMSAQWDGAVDISNCIYRLMKISTNDIIF
jgi:hypothetical protein